MFSCMFPTLSRAPHYITSIIITNSFAHSATSPLFAYMSNPALNSRAAAPLLHQSASTAAPRLAFASTSAAARHMRLLQLLLTTCIRFSFCSPIASASASAPQLRPLQLLLPNCVRFNCCSPIASACDFSPCPTFSNIPSWGSQIG